MYTVRPCTLYILTPMAWRIFGPLSSAGQINILFCPLLSAFVCGKENAFFNRPLRSILLDKIMTFYVPELRVIKYTRWRKGPYMGNKLSHEDALSV